MQDKCGVFGVVNSPNAFREMYLGLHIQQHRGQESAGMVIGEPGSSFKQHKDLGLVTDVFDEEQIKRLSGTTGIGHVRYSTSGSVSVQDAQPFMVSHCDRTWAVSHNGNLTNAGLLRKQLEKNGAVFTTTSDTEVILHMVLRAPGETPVQKIRNGLEGVKGAFSLVFLVDDGVIAVRDPNGFRPLYLGTKKDRRYFASETCAFDIFDGTPEREIQPGEGIYARPDGVETFELKQTCDSTRCSFEAIYFSRPDSYFNEESVHELRVKMGKKLWNEHPVEADLVTGIPDSANSATKGVAEASGLPHEICLIRSHYTGRSFIKPYQELRDLEVKKKFNLVPDVCRGKRVVVVDDSIVRGTTAKKIARMFRKNGAEEIHLRIASPSIQSPCYYGIDMPHKENLLVNRVDEDDLDEFLGVDSVEYLSEQAVVDVLGRETCRGCFTGNYPTEVNQGEHRMEKKKQKQLLDV